MAVKFGIGNITVSPAEYHEKVSDGSIAKFYNGLEKDRNVSLEFREGVITPQSFMAAERTIHKAIAKPVKGKKSGSV